LKLSGFIWVKPSGTGTEKKFAGMAVAPGIRLAIIMFSI
jgi:hypothetical protein